MESGINCSLCEMLRSASRAFRDEVGEPFVILCYKRTRGPILVWREHSTLLTRSALVQGLVALNGVASRCFGSGYCLEFSVSGGHRSVIARPL